MSEQAEIQTSKPPEKPPFQFGLKHLLAAPVVVALFFVVAAVTGYAVAVIVSLFALGVAGMFSATTRPVAAPLLIVLMAGILIVPAISGPRDGGGRRGTCMNNLKNIALALRCYEQKHGCFPPAYIADENGRPMHSWRVLILPDIERNDIYDMYDFSEPWDGPNNRKLAEVQLGFFSCPSDGQAPYTDTSYVAVVGPGTTWPGTRPTSLVDCNDGIDNTILIVELANSGINWMEPRYLELSQMTLTINCTAGPGISSLHPGGANVVFVDATVRFLPDDTLPEEVRAILTRSGGQSVDLEGF